MVTYDGNYLGSGVQGIRSPSHA